MMREIILYRRYATLHGQRAVTPTRRHHRGRIPLAAIIMAVFCVVWRDAGIEPSVTVAAQAPTAASPGLEVLEVRPTFFMIAGAGGNIGVQIGDDGVVVVDAGAAASAPAVLAAIKRISAKPIRYVIDTGPDADHVGGNEALSKAGEKFFGGGTLGGGAPNAAQAVAPIVS